MDQQPVIPINIILASNSPRRKQLLQDAGVQFRVFTPTEPVDETLDADLLAQPEEAVKKLAERKAGAAVQEVLAQNPVGLGFVIGADTMVVLDGEIFGKPYSADHAREMLRKLSGKTHQVITGVSVWMMLLNETEENGGDGNVSIGFPYLHGNERGHLQRAHRRRHQCVCGNRRNHRQGGRLRHSGQGRSAR